MNPRPYLANAVLWATAIVVAAVGADATPVAALLISTLAAAALMVTLPRPPKAANGSE